MTDPERPRGHQVKVLMPPVVLWETSQAWGSVRVVAHAPYADRVQTLHVELWPLGARDWTPFTSLTVIGGKLAYRNYDLSQQIERQLDGMDIPKGTV